MVEGKGSGNNKGNDNNKQKGRGKEEGQNGSGLYCHFPSDWKVDWYIELCGNTVVTGTHQAATQSDEEHISIQ
eukprot:12904647-Prorocentrum_lima.AAC.1